MRRTPMDLQFLHNLALGFGVALNWWNLLFCLVGVMLGTLVGVLPGIGPVATIAMLLPVTFTLSPTAATNTVETQPAMNDPIAEMESAAPARPGRAL